MLPEIKKSSIVINEAVYEGSCQSVCQTDIIVPDSMPDALKVLQAEGRAITEGVTVTSGKVSVRGKVVYNLLYVPDNAKGVKSISGEMPFTCSENVKDAKEGMMVSSQSEVTHMEIQLLNSRKISLKAITESDFSLAGKREIQYVSEVKGEDVQTREKTMQGENTTVFTQGFFNISNSMPVPSGGETLLKLDAEITSRDIKVISNKVVAKGEITVFALFSDSEDRPLCEKTVIPFTEIQSADGINEKMSYDIKFFVGNTSGSIADTEKGREVKFDVNIKIQITAGEKVSFTAPCDIYGTKCCITPTTGNISLKNKGMPYSSKVEIREIVTLADDMPEISKIYKLSMKPHINSCKAEKGNIKTEGSAICTLTYISDKEDSGVQTAVFEIPFSNISGESVEEGCKVMVRSVEGEKADCSISGRNIELRGNINLITMTEKEEKVSVVTDISATEEEEKDIPVVVLYFVQKGDDIWNIAKRYHSKISDIEQINKIDGDNIKEGMMLLIPKK